MNNAITIALLLGIVAMFIVPHLIAASHRTSPDNARELVSRGALLVDVRTPGEYNAGHIDGALNIPLQELGRRVGELGDSGRDIVLYCRSGNRSGQARKMLLGAGYSAVHDLGGIDRW